MLADGSGVCTSEASKEIYLSVLNADETLELSVSFHEDG